jgi:hypothetical protein
VLSSAQQAVCCNITLALHVIECNYNRKNLKYVLGLEVHCSKALHAKYGRPLLTFSIKAIAHFNPCRYVIAVHSIEFAREDKTYEL